MKDLNLQTSTTEPLKDKFWLPFICLYLATIISQLANVVYQKTLANQDVMAVILPSLIFLSIVTLPSLIIGLTLGKKIGIGLIKPSLLEERSATKAALLTVLYSILLGVCLLGLRSLLSPYLPAEVPAYGFRGITGGFLVSIGAAVGEEIWFRFGLLTLLLWGITRLSDRIKLTNGVVFLCILIAAIAFAAAHLPQLIAYGAGSSFAIWGTMLGNIAVSLLFSWCFWHYGLLYAILAHFSVDIVLHVLPAMY